MLSFLIYYSNSNSNFMLEALIFGVSKDVATGVIV